MEYASYSVEERNEEREGRKGVDSRSIFSTVLYLQCEVLWE